MFWVYVLHSSQVNQLYIGCTNNLKRRLSEHLASKVQSTRRYSGWKLVYCEGYLSESDAYEREGQLKRFAQAYDGLKKRISNSLRKVQEE